MRHGLKILGRVLGGAALGPLALVAGLLLSAASHRGAGAAGAPAARWAPDSATVQVAAGPEYAAGPLWRALWGAHHRALWATPVSAPVLWLGAAGPGGLRPLRAGGSYQTHSLRLRAADGRAFVLRSVDKDARVALPAGWVRRLLGPLMRDQTSAGHPYGAYVAARLAQAAGVLHTNPRLVYLPDDPALGPFRAAYGRALYLLEERPAGDQRRAPTLGASARVVGSAELLAAVGQGPAAPATAQAFLRARLLDMWLGDWSRRPDQWRWATLPTAGAGPEFRPIPRDRDQAFFQMDDGLYPWLIGKCRARYQSFGPRLTAANVAALAVTARPLDTLLLRGLPAAAFQQEAVRLRQRLTDAAIDSALQAVPPETRAVVAAGLGPALRARRAQLPAVAGWFYEAVNERK
ncbi:hypothetical protein [Hymenobacter sp. PAMC 26628]|uniref:hypothetical protein n=1 Tax=Hymenobacter sp. PAMC 26628 TaxID=1484118 RepID=UPI0007706973|nr:hypothetical protein [Hymenobacter sp. PAMC 26628]AMJ65713.1 hypothetical protein AXW84_09945 [Hymenobacter sp. PAMC 26628]